MSQIVDFKMLLENCIILPNSGWMKIPSPQLKSICLFFTPLMTNYGKKKEFHSSVHQSTRLSQCKKKKKKRVPSFSAIFLYVCGHRFFFRICQPCSMLFFRAKLNFLLFLLLFSFKYLQRLYYYLPTYYYTYVRTIFSRCHNLIEVK